MSTILGEGAPTDSLPYNIYNGMSYVDQDAHQFYVFWDNEWTLAPLAADPGPTGATGPTGPPGATGGPADVKLVVRSAALQSITSATPTTVVFGTTSSSTGVTYASNTATIVTAGNYKINAQALIVAASLPSAIGSSLSIVVNGTAVARNFVALDGSMTTTSQISAVLPLAVSDTVLISFTPETFASGTVDIDNSITFNAGTLTNATYFTLGL